MDSCLIVDLCGRLEAEVPYSTILVTSASSISIINLSQSFLWCLVICPYLKYHRNPGFCPWPSTHPILQSSVCAPTPESQTNWWRSIQRLLIVFFHANQGCHFNINWCYLSTWFLSLTFLILILKPFLHYTFLLFLWVFFPDALANHSVSTSFFLTCTSATQHNTRQTYQRWS